MKIILAMVTSVNGKSTKGSLPPGQWNSKEDKEYLHKLINSQNLIVMGRKTYEAAKSIIQLKPNILRIVLTKSPKIYQKLAVKNQLEFSEELPKKLIQRLTGLGYKQLLLLGGADLNSQFFKDKLINELWLTIEPLVFGEGNGLVTEENFDIHLKLKSLEKLNQQGTLLLKYQII
ncbi:dihydrofolate reductase family protein [Candidatus Daviesbacteria bacterium]|nr:dihydrofolate reductase family protein [Candidatus Daviesbacteria bacterium]